MLELLLDAFRHSASAIHLSTNSSVTHPTEPHHDLHHNIAFDSHHLQPVQIYRIRSSSCLAAMAPIIASTGQTRSRLPTQWLQNASAKSSAATAVKHVDHDALLQGNPVRWSTHTLAADPNDTVRSCADSTTSTYVDTFAHRRKGRVSDMTFVDPSDDDASAALMRSQSRSSSLDDLSLTLNDDDDDASHLTTLTKYKANLIHDNDTRAHNERNVKVDSLHSKVEYDSHDDDMATRIDRLMAATMEALEASNRLVLDTLSSRAKLAQLNAMEAALDSHLDAREAHLHRQIQAVTDMTDFVSKTAAELHKLTSPAAGLRVTSGAASAGQITTLADSAELQVREAAATGIVQALDRDATIGKTAAKRLERMLQTPSPNASPSSAASPQRRNTQSSRRAFSVSNFASKQASIAEEGDEKEGSPRLPGTAVESKAQALQQILQRQHPTAAPRLRRRSARSATTAALQARSS